MLEPETTTSKRGGQSICDRPLTENQIDLLNQFGAETCWLRPLDLGGRNGSNHSAVLAQLVQRGIAQLVESKIRSSGMRGSKLYRITSQDRPSPRWAVAVSIYRIQHLGRVA